MNLSDLDEQFIVSRRDEMQRGTGTRNSRMTDYLKLYKMDLFPEQAEPGERRIASPRAFTVIESYRTLLFTRRPVINVEESAVKQIHQHQAEAIEKYLYGAWHETRFLDVIDEVEFWACTAGRGVFKILYQPEAPDDELPLMVQSVDPRHFYNNRSTFRPDRSVEVAHSFERSRREIEQDWGEIPDDTRPKEQGELEKWLDEEIEYTDYWREVVVEEDAEEDEREKGMMEQVAEAIRRAIGGDEEEEEPRTVRKRKVVNAVLAGDRFVKEPVFVPGYDRLPFFYWDGVHTPLSGKDQALSVLYPIAGGERKAGTQGLLATESQMLATKLRLVEIYANAAAITNDESLANLDMRPGAVNVAGRDDYRIDWAMPPTQPPEVDRMMMQVEKLSEDATIPSALQGRYQGEISGVALSLMTNPVLMRIAARQRQREEVLQEANKLILSLTEEWAPAEGWTVWGADQRGQEFEVSLSPLDIHGYRRNTIKLSASLPKDAQGEMMLHANLVQQKLESRRTAINRMQELTGALGHTPHDEINQILIESILMDEDQTRRLMAMRALQDFDAALAVEIMQQVQEQPGPEPEPQRGRGPMNGIPPEVVPPEAMGGGGTGARPPEPPMGTQGPPAVPPRGV